MCHRQQRYYVDVTEVDQVYTPTKKNVLKDHVCEGALV